MTGHDRFAAARAAFGAVHAGDPTGQAAHYHDTLLAWVDTLDAAAPLVVRLAALGQHVERWTLGRADYPEGRTGYRAWRSTLSRMHAARAAEILRGAGWDDDTTVRVGELLVKKRLSTDPDAALLEDAVCLTFLQLQLAAFAATRAEALVVEILRKTWGKMTPRGQAAARTLVPTLAQPARSLVLRAVAES